MPSKEQDFSYPGKTTDELLQAAYGTFLSLGWSPRYSGPGIIVGYTPRSWNKYDDEITITATAGSINIKSSLVHGEMMDALGKNKKHIAAFSAAFEKTVASALQPEWQEALKNLNQQTQIIATEQMKEAEETDKVMKQSGSNLYVTYAILAINVVVFILMVINGAGIFSVDDTSVHIKWGSNVTSLTLSGEWWRLLTCTFIHFGILHLAMNSYALYMAGVFLEPMLGKVKYTIAYLSTGVFSSIASLWWHKDGVNSAGASGAIFGLYGIFLALLLTNLIPKKIRTAMLPAIGVYVLYSLVWGMKAGADNAGHIGGLLSGMLIGFIFYAVLSKKINITTPVITVMIAGATVVGAWYFFKNYKTDVVVADKLYNEFFVLQDKAVQANEANENTASPMEYKKVLSETILPAWKKNLSNLEEMGTLNLSEFMRKEQGKLKKYTQLKIEETELQIKQQDTIPGIYLIPISEVRNKINELLKENKQ